MTRTQEPSNAQRLTAAWSAISTTALRVLAVWEHRDRLLVARLTDRKDKR